MKKKLDFNKIIDEILDVKFEALDIVLKEMVEPIRVVDNPETIMGKPFEAWTPDDLEFLKIIYGTEEPNILSNFIFDKTYERVKTLESEER